MRSLALDLKIHPNTAHKVVQHLIQERWLMAQPGVGTVVAQAPKARAGQAPARRRSGKTRCRSSACGRDSG